MSEQITGQALKNLKVPRENVVVVMKVFCETAPDPNSRGLSRGHVLDGVKASLKRLQLDHIDLHQVHGFDPASPNGRRDQLGEIETPIESVSKRRRAYPVTRSTKVRCRTDPSGGLVETSSLHVPAQSQGPILTVETFNDSVHQSSHPVAELAAKPSVNVAYSPPGDACGISVTGTALLIEGGDKAKSFWSRSADAWFSGGPTDPDLAVIQVRIVQVSEWEAGADPGSWPAMRSEDVGFCPPDHLPKQSTPASENAALLFERSCAIRTLRRIS